MIKASNFIIQIKKWKIWGAVKTATTSFWKEFSTVIELFIYLGVACLICLLVKKFGIDYIYGVIIVFGYFLLCMLRSIVEKYCSKQ